VTEEIIKERPEPQITSLEYWRDAKVRWQIHQYETKILWKDLVLLYDNTKPLFDKSIEYLKDSYNRAFKEVETDTTRSEEESNRDTSTQEGSEESSEMP